jgi:uncharacterized protein with PhoU and TrkA domain
MRTYDSKFLEKELSNRVGKTVSLKGMVFSAEEGALYRSIMVDGEYSGIMFDIEDLTEYDKRGILEEQLDKLANKLKEHL